MNKKVAVVMGGYSSEFSISVESGHMVLNALKESEFDAYEVLILKNKWVAKVAEIEYPIDKNDFSFRIDNKKVNFDIVFNAIHGTPGEDGLIQAYFDLIGMKHTSSDFSESSLTFHKGKTNMVMEKLGVRCPKGMYYNAGIEVDEAELIESLGFPMFIKPSRSGSSYGISRVTSASEISSAIAEARKEDSDLVIEAAVIGTEVGCGIARINGNIEVLAITEIVSKNAFFDYQAKYEGASDEITPARISEKLQLEIESISTKVYSQLSLKGVVRIDFIIEESTGSPIFIEVNTVPGFSGASIVPQQVAYKGIELKSFFSEIIKEALK